MLERYILENPYPVGVALIALGAVMLWAINARGPFRRALVPAAACWLTALAIMVTAANVETRRESLTNQTHTVLEAVIDANRRAIEPIVSDDLLATTRFPDAFALRKEQFLRIIEGMSLLGIRDWSASPRGASDDAANGIRVDFAVRVATSGGVYAGTTPSVWRFHWRRDRQGAWKLRRLECLSIWGQQPDPDILRWATQFMK